MHSMETPEHPQSLEGQFLQSKYTDKSNDTFSSTPDDSLKLNESQLPAQNLLPKDGKAGGK